MRTISEYRVHVALDGSIDDFMNTIQELNGTVEGASNVIISAQCVACGVTSLRYISQVFYL